jgi:ferredoxin
MFKVAIDKTKCIGCGACTTVSKNFKIGSDEKSEAVMDQVEELGDIKDALEICPVGALVVTEEKKAEEKKSEEKKH